MSKVSIIIPVYNGEFFVRNCLLSCLEQSLQDIEIIIVDDKSTDNTVKIIKEFQKKDNRIILIELKENHHQGNARNIGIKQSKSDYICFLDVDDTITKDCIEKVYKKIVDDQADMTIFQMYTIDHKTGEIKVNHEYSNYVDLPKELHNGFRFEDIPRKEIFNKCNVVWDKIYKKSFLIENNIKFPTDMFFEDDVFSFQALFKAKKITCLAERLIYYRVNRSDSTCILKDKNAFDCFKMYKKIKEEMINSGYYDSYKEEFMLFHVLSLFYFYNRTFKTIKKRFFQAMKQELPIYRYFIDDKKNKEKDLDLYLKLSELLK